MRKRQARAVRKVVDEIVEENRDAAILVIGDFNDNYGAPIITETLLSSANRSDVIGDSSGRTLYNLHATLAEENQGTIYYRRGRTWNSFDGISVSRALLRRTNAENNPTGWTVKEGSYEVVRCPELVDEEGYPKPFRPIRDRKSGRKRYVTGYSDHLPVKVAIEMKP
jgi:endonuclease/exonuclease/phosphatase family metal-dependent hydrolase